MGGFPTEQSIRGSRGLRGGVAKWEVLMTRICTGLFIVGSLLFLCSRGVAEQAVDGRQSPYRPVASVKDIMEAVLEPSTEVIFDAVSVRPDGSVEKGPADDAAWATVRMSALVMSEGGNLLMMAGRRMSTGPALTRSPRPATRVELMPQLATRVSTTRGTWIKRVEALIDAGSVTLDAVAAKDANALIRADDAIDAACEACHHAYWYP
jgi:hypothetical protein